MKKENDNLFRLKIAFVVVITCWAISMIIDYDIMPVILISGLAFIWIIATILSIIFSIIEIKDGRDNWKIYTMFILSLFVLILLIAGFFIGLMEGV